MYHRHILKKPTGLYNTFLLSTVWAFEKCLVLVLSSGRELHEGGCTSLMTRLGPGTVLLLLHPAQTGLFILVDLGYFCGESRSGNTEQRHMHLVLSPSVSELLSLILANTDLLLHLFMLWEEIMASYAVLSEDTKLAQIKWCTPTLLGGGTTLHIQQESDFQFLGDFPALSSQHMLFLLGWCFLTTISPSKLTDNLKIWSQAGTMQGHFRCELYEVSTCSALAYELCVTAGQVTFILDLWLTTSTYVSYFFHYLWYPGPLSVQIMEC